MNGETLHAIDALYLESFLGSLLYKALDAECELRACLRHAQTLSGTDYLSPDCRSRYAAIRRRLEPLVSELEELTGDLYSGGKLASDSEPLVQWGLIEPVPEYETKQVIERLESAEQQLISTLNQVGARLGALPRSSVSWASQARVKTYLKLRPIRERPCYQDTTIVRFCASPPYQSAHYFAELPEKVNDESTGDPWLLDAELLPLTTLPLIEDVEIELEVQGEMGTSGDEQRGRRQHVIKHY